MFLKGFYPGKTRRRDAAGFLGIENEPRHVYSKPRQRSDRSANIGKAMAKALCLLDITESQKLAGRHPYEMSRNLWEKTVVRQDLCVPEPFPSIRPFMNGGETLSEVEFHSGEKTERTVTFSEAKSLTHIFSLVYSDINFSSCILI